MTKPFTKSEARQFAKETRRALRWLEDALQQDDYYEAYQSIYTIGSGTDLFIQRYEDWEQENG